jgi:hypothetical protein
MIRQIKIIAVALFLVVCESSAVSIVVPSSAKMVSECNAIVLVEMAIRKEGGVNAKIKEVLKGKQSWVGKTVSLKIEPIYATKIDAFVRENPGRPTLILGMLAEDDQALSLPYVWLSIWPDWARDDVTETESMEECRAFIRVQLEKDRVKEKEEK